METGLFRIGKLFHLTQVVDDLDAADRWYNRIFSPCRFYRGYMKEAYRDASLFVIGDAILIEPVQVSREPDAAKSPLGRFKARFGARLHSIAWYVDDLENAVEALRSHGVRLVDVAGRPIDSRGDAQSVRYVWTHPRDSHGLLEFARLNHDFTTDPRFQPNWSSAFWQDIHPLGIAGAFGITIVVRDLSAAARFYETVLGASEVEPAIKDGRRAFRVGLDTIVDIVGADSIEASTFGEGVYGMTFHVQNVDRAEAFLQGLGQPVQRVDERSLLIRPSDALGATVCFRQLV